MEINRDGAEGWLAEQWTQQFGGILESMTGAKAKLDWAPATHAPCADGVAVLAGETLWQHQFPVGDRAALWVHAKLENWQELATRTLKAAGVDSVDPEDLRNTYTELLDQSFAGLAQAIGARRKQRFPGGDGGLRPSLHSGVSWATVQIQTEGHPAAELSFGVTAQMVEAIERAPEPLASEAPVELAEASVANSPVSKTFDVLLDVALPVSVSFGRTQLAIKEVVKLTTGSIVELNRSVAELVEVIVNNCVIARGEVVVVEGNYGVRIHQIVSRNERLRQTGESVQGMRHSKTPANSAAAELAQ